MKLICEYNESRIQTLTEGTGDTKKVFIEGVFMQAEKENRNRRIYRKSVLQEAVAKYVAEQVTTGRAVGELNHPEGPSINLDKVSHRITELSWNGDDVIGKALILNTPMGLIVKGLIDGGVKLGVSSRGMGSVESKGGSTYVKDDFILSTIDIVQDPSAPSAFVEGIMEGVEFFKSGNEFVAHRVEEIRKTISKTSKANLAEAQVREFQKFLRDISA
jgi:hypothetical protein